MERRVCGPLELGLLLLYCREGLRCDLWCMVLRPGLEPVPAEYQQFDRVTSSSIGLIAVNLRAMMGYEGGIAVFILNILVGLSGQLRAPAVLYLGKYSPICLLVESCLSGSTDTKVASVRNRATIPQILSGAWSQL